MLLRQGGLMYSGFRFGTINKYAQTMHLVTTANNAFSSSNINFTELSGYKSQRNRNIFRWSKTQYFLMTSNEDGQKLKTNFTIPAIIGEVDGDSFDERRNII